MHYLCHLSSSPYPHGANSSQVQKFFYELKLTCQLDHAEESHRQVYEQGEEYHHEAKFSHEAIAGAASFAGMKAWEDHQRKLGTSIPLLHPLNSIRTVI